MQVNESTYKGLIAFCNRGQFKMPAEESTPGAVKDDKGRYWKTINGTLEGSIIGFDIKESKAEDMPANVYLYLISGENQEERGTIVFSLNSGYWKSFSRTVPNINFDLPVEIGATISDEDPKTGFQNTGLVFKQNGAWLKRFYKKENWGSCPQPKEVEVNGKKHWDYSEQNNFLLNLAKKAIAASNEKRDPKLVENVGFVNDDEDVPF